jgi:hypothetical protein
VKILTVQQPWAWAIIHGGKDIENRTQAWSYRGPLAIHAGLAKPEKGNLASAIHRLAHGSEVPTELVFGAVIGIVELVDVHASHDCVVTLPNGSPGYCSLWAHPNCVHLKVTDAQPLRTPIPAARGRLGLWTPDSDLLDAIEQQLILEGA